MTFATAVDSLFDSLIDRYGGTAATVQANPTGTSNTKTLSADDCLRKDFVRSTEEGQDRDSCTFVVRASAFTSGFSASNPVTPVAGMTFTVSGESVWFVRTVVSVSGAAYVLRCVGA